MSSVIGEVASSATDSNVLYKQTKFKFPTSWTPGIDFPLLIYLHEFFGA
jgi:hypothetical protein